MLYFHVPNADVAYTSANAQKQILTEKCPLKNQEAITIAYLWINHYHNKAKIGSYLFVKYEQTIKLIGSLHLQLLILQVVFDQQI